MRPALPLAPGTLLIPLATPLAMGLLSPAPHQLTPPLRVIRALPWQAISAEQALVAVPLYNVMFMAFTLLTSSVRESVPYKIL